MKLFLKIAKRTILILLLLILVGYGVYRFAYPYVAPILFDYLVDRNAQMFVQLEESLEASLDTIVPDIPEETLLPECTPVPTEPSSEPQKEVLPAEEKPKPTPASQTKPNTEIQTVHTTMGDFTGAQLVRALKNISPADKTRIIAICQQAVSMSDMVTVSQILMSDGLTVGQQKYIENYLRDNLSVPAKREILTILQKY